MACNKADTMAYVVSFLEKLVNTPSPSGFTEEVMSLVEREAAGFGFSSVYSRKGGLIIEVPGDVYKRQDQNTMKMELEAEPYQIANLQFENNFYLKDAGEQRGEKRFSMIVNFTAD